MKTMKTLECGMSKSRLMAYVYSTPAEPAPDCDYVHKHVQHCGICQNVVAEYQHMDQWVQHLRNETQTAHRDEGLAQSFLDRIDLPWRKGHVISVPAQDDNELGISEMFMRRLTRKLCMDPDVAVLRTEVDNAESLEPLKLNVDVALRYGASIPEVAKEIRDRVFSLWEEQTSRPVDVVNVTVLDVFGVGVE